MDEKQKELEYHISLIRGLINYHDRSNMYTMGCEHDCEKAQQWGGRCPTRAGSWSDSYRDALVAALTALEEKRTVLCQKTL